MRIFDVFLFQAEDCIRVHCVTGVQTCALPISYARLLDTLNGKPVSEELRANILAFYSDTGAPFATKKDEKRSEEHTSELQSHSDLVCRLLLEKKKKNNMTLKTNNKNKIIKNHT